MHRWTLILALVAGLAWVLGAHPAAQAEDEHGRSPLAGIVRDAKGTPVGGVEVTFRRYAWGSTKWSAAGLRARFAHEASAPVVARTTTAADGRWRMDVPGVGRAGSLQFVAPDGRVATSVYSLAPPMLAPPLESVLLDVALVTIRLVDHEGRPVAGSLGVRVELSAGPVPQGHNPPGFGLSFPLAQDGVTRVPAPAGSRLVVSARAPEVGDVRGIRIDPSTTPEATIELRRAGGPRVRGVVRDEEGAPVADAFVVAQLAQGTSPFEFLRNEAFARTDAEGRYALEHLPGRYLAGIAVWKEGYAIAASPGTSGGGNGLHLPTDRAFDMDVTLGRGRTIRGTVVDEQGTPLPDAKVWLSEKLVGSFFPVVAYEPTTSDADGRFTLSGLPLHAGWVRARTDTHRLASYWQGDGPHGHRIARDMPAVIDGVRLVLTQGRSVTGRLINGADKPVPGAAVRLSYIVGRGSVLGHEPVWSDAHGRFAFHGLPKVQHPSVRIDAPGFVRHEARLGQGGAAGATIRLPRGGVIRGRVLNREGRPVPHTSVRCDPSAVSAVTDAEGRFLLERLPPGRLTLTHGGPGGSTGLGQTLVDLAEGAVVKDVTLRLTSLSASPGEESIAGQAVDEQGRPHAGFRLEVSGIGPIMHTVRPQSVVTDEHGHFRVDGLVHGQYTVQPWPPIRRAPIVRAGTLDAVVEFPSRETYVLEGRVVGPDGTPIPQGVVEATHRGAARNVMVSTATLFDGRFRMDLRRGASSYHLRVGRPSDHHGRPLNLILATPLEVGGPHEPIEVRLVEAASIRGVLRDEDGKPVRGTIVEAMAVPHPTPLDMPRPAESDAEGRFALTGLRPGTYRVSMRVPAGFEPPPTQQIRAPTAEPIAFTVKRLASIAGRILDGEGAPVGGVHVTAIARPREPGTALQGAGRARSAMFANGVTDRDGRFVIIGLSTDFVYDLNVGLPTALRVRHFVPTLQRIEPNGDELTVELTPAITITGRVLAPDGSPASKVQVSTFGPLDAAGARDATLSAGAVTDDQGRFEVGPLRADGEVTLRAWITPPMRTVERPWLPSDKVKVATGARDVELTMRQGVELRGRIEGVTPAEIHHLELLATAQGAGEAGRFQFDGSSTTFRIVGLEPGRYRLVLRRVNRGLRFHEIPEVTAPADGIVVRRWTEVMLEGRVTGIEAKGWQARWLPGNGRGPSPHAAVGDDGRFRVGPVGDAPGVLYVHGPDKTKVVWMPLKPSKKPIAAKPVATKPIKGKILGLPDKVQRGSVIAHHGPLRHTARITDDGYFDFEHLPPGPWTLTFQVSRPRGHIESPEPVTPGNRMVFVKWKKAP